MRRTAAFTLVELLAVIAIIGALISLLLPGLQTARGAARRASCSNNVRQLTTAILAFENRTGRLPRAGIVADLPEQFDPRSGNMISWQVLILPEMEQGSLYRQFNLKKSILQQEGEPQAVTAAYMLCPEDSARDRYYSSSLTSGRRFAKGNYAAYCSPFHTDLQYAFPGALSGRGQKMTSIRDGASSTLLLSEVRTLPVEADQRGAWALPWTASSLLAFDMHGYYAMDPNGGRPVRRYKVEEWDVGYNQPPNNQKPNVDMLYGCPDIVMAQLQGMPCGDALAGGDWAYLSAAPRSRHPGGVNASFLDGHVSFLPNEIDNKVMAYLVSIDDGFTITESDYQR